MSSRCTHIGCPTEPNGPLFDRVRGVFRTVRADVLAVLFDGDRQRFRDWARACELTGACDHQTTPTSNDKGAME